MKLYTEEQVKEAYFEGWNDGRQDNIGYVDRTINQLTPIELPSRDMADEAALTKSESSKIDFLNGFIWTKEQILNQNK